MDLKQYFKLEDTPSARSPVGQMMTRLLADDPSLTFDAARQLAKNQLLKASARKHYGATTVRQDEIRSTQLRLFREKRRGVPGN